MGYPHYSDKSKPRSGIPLPTFGLLLFMVILGVMIGGSAMLASAPTLFNHRATQDHYSTLEAWISQREGAVVATQAALAHEFNRLELAATQQAAELAATAAALGNDAGLLRQTATQLASFAQATATANAALTSRQMTQVALDFVATQSQINQSATQAALNFAATQAAFGTPEAALPAQAQALSLAVPASPTFLPFDSSPTPSSMGVAVYWDFAAGIPSQRWLTSGSADWSQSQRGVVAQQGANAWLLARAPANGRLEVTFEPALASPAAYRVLVLGRNGENWYLQIDTETLRATRAALYRFDGGLPVQGVGELLAETALNAPLNGLNLLQLDLFNGFEARFNGAVLLRVADRMLPMLPQFGVQFPAGALVATVQMN